MFNGLMKDSVLLGTALHLGRRVRETDSKARTGRSNGSSMFAEKELREYTVWPPE